MSPNEHLIYSAILASIGVWLMMPPSGQRLRAVGMVVAASGFGWLMARMPGMGDWASDAAFWTLAAATVAAAVATVASHNPVYCALWFALSLLGTAGVFAVQGAQFLAAATIVVYAGAIVVTFLFVLMLAQPDGTAFYDRVGWGRVTSLLACACPAVIVGVLAMLLAGELPAHEAATSSAESLAAGVAHGEHVARLGGALFTEQLVAIELAGTLLLVALVGAVAITAHERQRGDRAGRSGAAAGTGATP